MLCHDDIFCLLNLILKFLGWKVSELYAHDSYFAASYSKCSQGKGWGKIHFHDRFLFRVNKLCIPDCSLCIMFLQEAHSGGLMGHFGVKKTEQVLINHFF
jgi:hypothetical protein